MRPTQSAAYTQGQAIHWRDFNLRHPINAMRVLWHRGDTVRVQFPRGHAGDILSRDLIDPETEETNAPTRIAP